MKKLKGKVAIITGGASGMGAAAVARFAAEGAHVISTDIQIYQGEEVAHSAGAHFMEQDTCEEAGWEQVTEFALDRFGRLDIVMNNAGITTGKSIEKVDLKKWNRVIEVNLTGVMLGCRYGIRVMKQNPGGSSGSIINIASTTAFAALPEDVGYTASKGGVRMLTKSIAAYCGRAGLNIRCNNIVPGAVYTGLTSIRMEKDSGLYERLAKISPLNRMGTGDDIAAAALFLASEDSSFITGADLLVDGGTMAVHPGF
ncbi:MAG: SDR family oxidoreductase [Desulfobacterales bacterium]